MATALEVREIVIRVRGATEAAEAYKRVSAEGDEAAHATEDLGRKAKASGEDIKRSIGEKASAAFSAVGKAALAAAAVAGAAFVRLGWEALLSEEKGTNALSSVMGSAEAAEAELERLRTTAELPSVDLTSAIRISAMLQAIGYSADAARQSIAVMANEVTKSGGGPEELDAVARSISSAIARGKLEAEDLNEIRTRMFSVAGAMKDLGATTAAELNKMFGGARGAFEAIFGRLAGAKQVKGGLALAVENAGLAVKELAKQFVSGLLRLDEGSSTEDALVALSAAMAQISGQTRDAGEMVASILPTFDSLREASLRLAITWKFVSVAWLQLQNILGIGDVQDTASRYRQIKELREEYAQLASELYQLNRKQSGQSVELSSSAQRTLERALAGELGPDAQRRAERVTGRSTTPAEQGAVAGQATADAMQQYDRAHRRQTNRAVSRLAAEAG